MKTRTTSEYVTAWCGHEPKRHDKCDGLDGKCQCACHAINAITNHKEQA